MIDGTPIGIARELVRDLAHGMEQACKGDIGRPENGVARIGVDRRRLLWIWTRSFMEWLSVALWRWTG